jgi:hypothetical protein
MIASTQTEPKPAEEQLAQTDAEDTEIEHKPKVEWPRFPDDVVHVELRGIKIGDVHAQVNNKLYKLSDIRAIEVREVTNNRRFLLTLLTIGTVLAVLLGTQWLIGAVVTLAITVLLIFSLFFAIPSSYIMRITDQDGSADRLMSRDKNYIRYVETELRAACGLDQSKNEAADQQN